MKFNNIYLSKIMVSVFVSVLIIYVSKIILNQDPALHLAQQLHLGNGIVLGGLLGGLTGLYLSTGKQERITRFGGLVIGITVGVWFFQWGKPHAWIIEAILTGTFGENGALYAPLASVMLLFFVIRLAADMGNTALRRLLVWGEAREEYNRLVKEAVKAEVESSAG